MRWYWVVECDNTVSDPLVTDSDNLETLGFDEWDFRKGIRIDINTWPTSVFVKALNSEDDGEPDDVLQTHLGIPIYSERLRIALEEANIAGIQYLPLNVLRPNGEAINGYSIANILNLAPALDLDKSDYDVYPDDYFLPERRGLVSGVREGVLKADKLENCDIIRLEEYKVKIYASKKFKEVFENNNFTGYSFHEVKVALR